MTSNKYWVFLEKLRRSGKMNMFFAAPYVELEFGVSRNEAIKIVADWMENYNPSDYEAME